MATVHPDYTVAADVGVNTAVADDNFPATNRAPAADQRTMGARDITYVTIGFVGMVGNILVILVMLSSRSMRSKLTNVFLVNQSFIDLSTAVFLIATNFNNEYYSGGHFGLPGELYCRLWSTRVLMWSMFMSSTYNLVALTLERYAQIIHPIWHKTSFGSKKAAIVLVLVWLIGPAYNLPLMVPTSPVIDGVCWHMIDWPHPAWQTFAGVFTFVIEFLVPLAIIAYAYARMIKVIRGKIRPSKQAAPPSASSGQQGDSAGSKREETMERVSRNILKTLALVSLCFILCWVWNQVYFLLFNLGFNIDLTNWFFEFTVYAAFVNCCTNPMVYLLKYNQFQRQLLKLLCGKKADSFFEDGEPTVEVQGSK